MMYIMDDTSDINEHNRYCKEVIILYYRVPLIVLWQKKEWMKVNIVHNADVVWECVEKGHIIMKVFWLSFINIFSFSPAV